MELNLPKKRIWPKYLPSREYGQKIRYYQGPFNGNQKLHIVEDLGIVGIKGDVNQDNNVNIIDIVDIVNVILYNEEISPSNLWAGDMDFNLQLNVIDINKLINFIFLE